MYKGYWLGMAGKYDSSCALLAEAQSLATKATLFALQGEIKVRQAMVCYLQGQFEASRTLYKSVVDTQGDSCGPYLHAIAIGGVGKSLMAQGMFEQALEWLYKASEVAREGGFTLLSASHASEIGVCHTGLGNIEKALEVHREAGNALYEIGAMQHYQVNLADIGNVYVHKGDFLTAISYYRRALAIAEQINHPASIEKWNYNIRLAYIKLRESIDQIRPSLTTPLPPL
jgi:tetratricopeptide (TPR) repeat protein